LCSECWLGPGSYTTTSENVKYLFATAEPVARLNSGDILDTNTLDCFGNVIKKPGTLSAW
jgi:acetamidase/formamidase